MENELTKKIIGAAIETHRTLGGPGLLESIYEEALCHELVCHLEPLTNLALKFMRVHNETIEVLNRYRRGGEQKVTVIHIAEKMAVVNNYGYTGGGGNHKNQGESPCQQENAALKPEQTSIGHAGNPQWQTGGADSMEAKVSVRGQKKG